MTTAVEYGVPTNRCGLRLRLGAEKGFFRDECISACRDREATVRRAVSALEFSVNAHAAKAEMAVDDPDWMVLEIAAETLMRTAGAESSKRLTLALADQYWQVTLRAVRSLGKLRVAESGDTFPLVELPGNVESPDFLLCQTLLETYVGCTTIAADRVTIYCWLRPMLTEAVIQCARPRIREA